MVQARSPEVHMTLLFPVALVQPDNPMMPGPGTGLVWLAVVVLTIAGLWKVFEKAGKPGWAAIVPIYNLVVLMEVAAKPLWWVLLMFIPFINIVVLLLVYIEVAHRFGKSTGFGWGMTFLGFIFLPILGFGDARYQPG